MSSSEYNGDQVVAVSILFLVFTYIAVGLRCFVRIKLTKAFQADDWLMLISQIIFTVSCAFILSGIHYGLGRHNDSLALEDSIEALKYQALATLTYVANMMFIKLSICVLLLRIAVQKSYIWILKISMIIVTIWSMGIFIYDIFQCTPVQAQWNLTIKGAKCVGTGGIVSAAYSISVLNILTDWLYALLPIPMIWNSKMNSQTKITVGMILSLGVFASVATLIRLKFLADLTNVDDILYAGTPPMVWTLVEPGVAIVAGSLVTIRPLLRAFKIAGFSTTYTNETPGNNSHPIQMNLRNDIPSNNWDANIFPGGRNKNADEESAHESIVSAKGSVEAHVRSVGNGSQEYILGSNEIHRTVDIRISHESRVGS